MPRAFSASACWGLPIAEVLTGWFIGTFAFYWWHRCSGFLRILHQAHHSPSRVELLTAFNKHPLEIVSGIVLIPLLGRSVSFN